MKKLTLTMVLIASMGLSACDTLTQAGQKQQIGTVAGAVLGGVLGSKVGGGNGKLYATGIGVLLGTLVGGELGRSLDRADMIFAQEANSKAHTAPVGESIAWNNPQTGNSGSVTPVREGNDSTGSYCREYEQTIYVGGQEETGTGIACKEADGRWKIVS